MVSCIIGIVIMFIYNAEIALALISLLLVTTFMFGEKIILITVIIFEYLQKDKNPE